MRKKTEIHPEKVSRKAKTGKTAVKKVKKQRGMMGKMMTSLIGSLLIVLLVSGFFLLRQARREITRLTDLDVGNQARSVELTAENYFTGFYSGLDILGQSPVIDRAMSAATQGGRRYQFQKQPDFQALVDTLSGAQESLPAGTKNIFVANKVNNQMVLSDGSVSDRRFSLSQLTWWKQLLANEGKPIVSSAYPDPSGEMVLTIASSIRQDDQIVGAVGATVNMDQVANLLSDFKVGDEGFVVIFDAFNKIIYHPNAEMVLQHINDTDYDKYVKKTVVGNQDALSFTYHRGEGTYHGTTYYIPSIHWQVLGTMPAAEFNSKINGIALVVLLCFSLAAALLAALIWINVGNMVRPIKKLKGVADRLAQGELDVAVNTERGDEIGDLGRSIQKIVDRLKTYIVYIDEVAAVLNQIGSRNLVYTLEQDYVGEFSKLKTALMDIQGELKQSMQTMADAAEQVDSDAQNMSSSAQALAQGAISQASAVDELAASVQELNLQAGAEAERARATSQSAEAIGSRVAESNQQMSEMLGAMNKITEQAKEIAKIVKTVEDIAFQTKILALNASVEAARAGAAGKGFAVVADEVQNLAGKSSQAAQSVTKLIHSTLEAVDEGARIADLTAGSMNEVAGTVETVVNAVDEIAQQYQTEARQLQEIASGIDQISSVVQTNSATAEESAATAEELTVQASKVKELVDSFRLEDEAAEEPMDDFLEELPDDADPEKPAEVFSGYRDFSDKY